MYSDTMGPLEFVARNTTSNVTKVPLIITPFCKLCSPAAKSLGSLCSGAFFPSGSCFRMNIEIGESSP